jgi:hypothetical protein
MKDYKNFLAIEIFSQDFHCLTKQQKAFVKIHNKEFINYKKNAAQYYREALGRKLYNKMYQKIFRLYCDRVTLIDIKYGIREGEKIARDYDKAVFAPGWFDPHILKRAEKTKTRLHQKIYGRIEFDFDPPWFYNLFLYCRERKNIKFDLWEGYNDQ